MATAKRKTVTTKARTAATKRAAKTAKGPKTQRTAASVAAFLARLDDATKADCERLDAWMREATGGPGVMYGAAIVGYGSSTIRYADGREAPWMAIGFSPRKQALTIYGVAGKAPASELAKLGKHATGKGCLYVKRLDDVDAEVLRRLIRRAGRGSE